MKQIKQNFFGMWESDFKETNANFGPKQETDAPIHKKKE